MELTVRFDARDAAFDVRKRVFMDEQGYENEFDQIDDDPRCIHVTLYVDGEVAGCSRVFPRSWRGRLHSMPPSLPLASSMRELGLLKPTCWGAWRFWASTGAVASRAR